MYTDLKVDDSCLRGKRIISSNDIKNLLPEEIQEEVEAIHVYVYVDTVKILWVIYLKENMGTYEYVPFSKEIIYNPYGREIRYGLIYFWRKTRFQRDVYTHKGTEKKVYATYICRPNHMLLLREEKQYWYDEGNGDGYCSKSRWFKAFP